VLLVAIATFFVGSVVCATSSSVARLVGGRAGQGAVAGGLIVLVNICISELFSMRFVGFD
jgi:MFS family permease